MRLYSSYNEWRKLKKPVHVKSIMYHSEDEPLFVATVTKCTSWNISQSLSGQFINELKKQPCPSEASFIASTHTHIHIVNVSTA